eukprot:gene4834-34587_t
MSSSLLSISINQDASCFACGMTTGFKVFSADPYRETFCRGFNNNGGIGLVEMLFRCNILAIVGGGPAPKYPPTKIRAVRLRRDRIVVALEHKVLVYNFADLKLLSQIETVSNVKGLVAVSSVADSTVLACPGLHTGQVRIELYDRRQTKFISAHNNALSCMALSLDGKRLCTASEKGTLIRVWNTADGQNLQELRRGADPAIIYSLALSRNCEWLAVSSDKGTVHVFALSEAVTLPPSDDSALVASDTFQTAPSGGKGGEGGPHDMLHADAQDVNGGASSSNGDGARTNPTSIFSMVKGFVPAIPLPKYFTSEWSFAQLRLQESEVGQCIVGFGATPNSLVVVTASGSFYRATFDPFKGGQATQESFFKFVQEAGHEGGDAP